MPPALATEVHGRPRRRFHSVRLTRTSTDAQQLARDIRRVADVYGLTLADLLADIGVSYTALHHWETGKTKGPRLHTYLRAREVLDTYTGEGRKSVKEARVEEVVLPLTRQAT